MHCTGEARCLLITLCVSGDEQDQGRRDVIGLLKHATCTHTSYHTHCHYRALVVYLDTVLWCYLRCHKPCSAGAQPRVWSEVAPILVFTLGDTGGIKN